MQPLRLLALLGLAVLAALPFVRRGEPTMEELEAGDGRALLCGVNGLSWALVQPLIDRGEMPHLARLQPRVSERTLASPASDITQSAGLHGPKAWTTVATGVQQADHGVQTLMVSRRGQYEDVPITSAQRRQPAVWDVASRFGRDVAVVGWPATWPADAVQGTLISDRFFAKHFGVGPYGTVGAPLLGTVPEAWRSADVAHLTFPEDADTALSSRLAELLAKPHELVTSLQAMHAEEDDLGVRRNLEQLESAVQHDRLVTAALLEQAGPTLALGAVCFTSLDVALPGFWKESDPQRWAKHADPRVRSQLDRGRAAKYHRVVTDVLVFLDECIGSLQQAMGEDAAVVLTATHTWGAEFDPKNTRRYSLNPVLERLGLFARKSDGTMDPAKTICFDQEIQPYQIIRSLSLNFADVYDAGIVEAKGGKEKGAAWKNDVLEPLSQVRVEPPWVNIMTRARESDLFWFDQPQMPGFHRQFGVFNDFAPNTNVFFPDGSVVEIDDLFPPVARSARVVEMPTLVFVGPEGFEGAGSERLVPFGQEGTGRKTVAATLLAWMGLPRPRNASGTAWRFQSWMMDREQAQRAALTTVPQEEWDLFFNSTESEFAKRRVETRKTLQDLGYDVRPEGEPAS